MTPFSLLVQKNSPIVDMNTDISTCQLYRHCSRNSGCNSYPCVKKQRLEGTEKLGGVFQTLRQDSGWFKKQIAEGTLEIDNHKSYGHDATARGLRPSSHPQPLLDALSIRFSYWLLTLILILLHLKSTVRINMSCWFWNTCFWYISSNYNQPEIWYNSKCLFDWI